MEGLCPSLQQLNELQQRQAGASQQPEAAGELSAAEGQSPGVALHRGEAARPGRGASQNWKCQTASQGEPGPGPNLKCQAKSELPQIWIWM